MVILSFVTVMGWLAVWGWEGSLGKHGTGVGWRNASGFPDGNGVGGGGVKDRHERDKRDTRGRQKKAQAWETSHKVCLPSLAPGGSHGYM